MAPRKRNPRQLFADRRVLITGGTGSLGQVLLRRLLGGQAGLPAKVVVFSRDEEKQHRLRLEYRGGDSSASEDLHRNADGRLEFRIGDVRDFASISAALRDIDIVFNAAALKQVPTCEYCPQEAILTNLAGPENI